MKFSDLLHVEYDSRTEIISLDMLCDTLPDTPIDVLQQFYSEHGRNTSFQNQYASLNIDKLVWNNVNVLAKDLVACTYYESFERWMQTVSQRVLSMPEIGWRCVDSRPDIVEHCKSI